MARQPELGVDRRPDKHRLARRNELPVGLAADRECFRLGVRIDRSFDDTAVAEGRIEASRRGRHVGW
jgi:hypothetical protein